MLSSLCGRARYHPRSARPTRNRPDPHRQPRQTAFPFSADPAGLALLSVGNVFWVRTPYDGRYSSWHLHFLVEARARRGLLVPVTTVRDGRLREMAAVAPCVLVPERHWLSECLKYQSPLLVKIPALRNVSLPFYRYATDWSEARIRLEIQLGHMVACGYAGKHVARAIRDGLRETVRQTPVHRARRYFEWC